jgi:hypothetical protein
MRTDRVVVAAPEVGAVRGGVAGAAALGAHDARPRPAVAAHRRVHVVRRPALPTTHNTRNTNANVDAVTLLLVRPGVK